MARAARIARDLTQAGATDDAFLRGKIATSRFYAEHVLPEAEAWRLEVTSGAASTLALADASF
jgi:3-(methylsulfanyl)propanoyl-CoA dehydrogenase